MSLVAIGITLGTPDVAAQVAVTATDGAALLTQALADLTTLATNITTTQTDTTTADNDAATDVTNTTTADNDAATDVTNTTTADTDAGTAGTDFDTVINDIIAITGDTYNSTTKQVTFGGATGLTHAQWAGTIGTAVNALGAILVTLKTDTAAAKASAATTKTATAAAKTSAATTKAATATAKADAVALSTSAVHTDIVNAQANFNSDVTFRTDSTKATTQSMLSAGLAAGLAFVNANAILPP